MNKVLYSKESDHWRTPNNLYLKYVLNGFYDPCPYHSNFDGLIMDWHRFNFVNPPYSKIKEWIDKSIVEHKKGNYVILLIPARTDTKYFKKLVNYGCDITFITGRLHFNGSNSAPFPSCIINLTGKNTNCYWKDRDDLC